MDVLISHHYIQPEGVQEELALLQRSGETMKQQPGFLYRVTLQANDDPTHVTTITFWRTKEDADRWDQNPARQQSRKASSTHWTKPVYRVRFNVVQSFKGNGIKM